MQMVRHWALAAARSALGQDTDEQQSKQITIRQDAVVNGYLVRFVGE